MTAKSKKCVCHCGGGLHGRAHSEQWIKETAAEIDAKIREQHQLTKAQAELFSDGDCMP